MRGPGLTVFRLNLRKAHSRRRVRNADQMLAGRALDLSTRELRFALERLITVGTVELEFVGVHGFCPHKRNPQRKSMSGVFPILFGAKVRLIW
jgi:hypothetical protein